MLFPLISILLALSLQGAGPETGAPMSREEMEANFEVPTDEELCESMQGRFADPEYPDQLGELETTVDCERKVIRMAVDFKITEAEMADWRKALPRDKCEGDPYSASSRGWAMETIMKFPEGKTYRVVHKCPESGIGTGEPEIAEIGPDGQ